MDEEGRWVTIRGRHVFIKNGQTVSEAIKEYEENKNKTSTTYYRGLTQKYDPNYDKSKLDNPNGYESWTDSLELAKEYAGKNGYVYSVEIPNNELNPDDIYDQDGERSLMYYNDKPVALHGVEGEEFMLYTDHEKWNDLEYKEEIGPEKTTYINGLKVNVEKGMTPIEAHKKYLEELPMREDIKKSMRYYHEIPYQGQILNSDTLKDSEFVHYDLPDKLDPSKRYYAESIKAEDGKYNIKISEVENDKNIHNLYIDSGSYEPECYIDYNKTRDGYDEAVNMIKYKEAIKKNLPLQLDALSKYDYATIQRLAENKQDLTLNPTLHYYNSKNIDVNLPEDELRYKLACYYCWNERENGIRVERVVYPNKKGAEIPNFKGKMIKPLSSEECYFETEDGKQIKMLDKKEYKKITDDFATELSKDRDSHDWVQSYISAFGTAYSDELNRCLSNDPINSNKSHGSKILINYDDKNLVSLREFNKRRNDLIDIYNKEQKLPDEYMSASDLFTGQKDKDFYDNNGHYITYYKKYEDPSTDQIKAAKEITTLKDQLSDKRGEVYRSTKEYKRSNPGMEYSEIKKYEDGKYEELGYNKIKSQLEGLENKYAKEYLKQDKVPWSYEWEDIAEYDTKNRIYNVYKDKELENHNLKWTNYKEAYDGLSSGTINKDLQSSHRYGVKRNLEILENGHKGFDEVFEKHGVVLDKPIMVFRRTALDPNRIEEGFTQYGLMSTSAQDTLAQKMPSGVSLGDQSMYIIIPAGQKILPVEKTWEYDANDPDEVSNARRLARQHEIILPMGTHLIYTGEKYNGSYIMEVDKDENYYRNN